jgi:hypothetical protein
MRDSKPRAERRVGSSPTVGTMPSKDKAIQAAAARRHYEKNKVAMKAKAAAAAPLRRKALAEWVNGLKENSLAVDRSRGFEETYRSRNRQVRYRVRGLS